MVDSLLRICKIVQTLWITWIYNSTQVDTTVDTNLKPGICSSKESAHIHTRMLLTRVDTPRSSCLWREPGSCLHSINQATSGICSCSGNPEGYKWPAAFEPSTLQTLYNTTLSSPHMYVCMYILLCMAEAIHSSLNIFHLFYYYSNNLLVGLE